MVLPTPKIFHLAENAWLIEFNTGFNVAANKAIHQLAGWLTKHALPGLMEVIPAYDSLMLQFDGKANTSSMIEGFGPVMEAHIQMGIQQIIPLATGTETPVLPIPVYYDTNPESDLTQLAATTGFSAQEIIQIHTSLTYHVFMLGFLPGFCYLGEVDTRIAFPRKKEPVKVIAGAVGIAGNQTGIYPLDSPGGWNIIGYTPLTMFDVNRAEPALVKPGVAVQFIPIDFKEYKSQQAQ